MVSSRILPPGIDDATVRPIFLRSCSRASTRRPPEGVSCSCDVLDGGDVRQSIEVQLLPRGVGCGRFRPCRQRPASPLGMEAAQTSVRGAAPRQHGSGQAVTAGKLGPQSTCRPRGRPRKHKQMELVPFSPCTGTATDSVVRLMSSKLICPLQGDMPRNSACGTALSGAVMVLAIFFSCSGRSSARAGGLPLVVLAGRKTRWRCCPVALVNWSQTDRSFQIRDHLPLHHAGDAQQDRHALAIADELDALDIDGAAVDGGAPLQAIEAALAVLGHRDRLGDR